MLYPAHVPVAQIPIEASVTLPPDWKFGTALTVTGQKGTDVSFAPVSLEQLVDSPMITEDTSRSFAGARDFAQALSRCGGGHGSGCQAQA